MNDSPLFSPDNLSTSSYMKFEKVGDSLQGVYVARREIVNKISGTPKRQFVYTIVGDQDGQPIDVYGKGKEPQGFPGLNSVPFGTHVGIRFDEILPSKKKGFADAKVINVYTKGELKLDVLRAFQESTGVLPLPTTPLNEEIPFA